MKVFIAFMYGETILAVPVSINNTTVDPMSGNGQMFELNRGSNVIEVEVPFRHVAEWANCMATSTFTPGNFVYSPFAPFIGTIGVYVVNPLMSSVGAPTSINMNSFIALGDDFEFGNYNPAPFNFCSTRIAQGVGDYIYPVVSLRDMMKRKVCVGRVVTSAGITCVLFDVMREMMKANIFTSMYRTYKGSVRFSFVAEQGVTEPVYFFWFPYQSCEQFSDSVLTGTTQAYQILDFVSSAFGTTMNDITETAPTNLYGVPGGVRKFTKSTAATNQTITVAAAGGTRTITTANRSKGIHCIPIDVMTSQTPSIDIEIPYMSNTKVAEMDAFVGGTIGFTCITVPRTITVFVSGGDDFRCGQFMGTPLLCPASMTIVDNVGSSAIYSAGINMQEP
jgi:hypothetical protein